VSNHGPYSKLHQSSSAATILVAQPVNPLTQHAVGFKHCALQEDRYGGIGD
jgi:hypothetical protein